MPWGNWSGFELQGLREDYTPRQGRPKQSFTKSTKNKRKRKR